MADLDLCPNRDTLERLLLGEIDPNEAKTLDEHLLGCEHCCTVLHELVAGDTLAGAARAASAEPVALDDRVRAVMALWKDVTRPAHATEETLARGPESTEDAWELEKLLDPSEAEGELGRFGGYRVLRVLGAGGMGLVLEAEDPKLRRRVALKIMKRSLASRDEHHQRFLREARAAAAIEHPHIVTVHQVGEHRGLPFMAMQLLRGESLDDRLRREPRLPLGECLRIGRETAEALAEAHGRNFIHRDIKPGNIWLEGANGWVKLVDFGLAHAAEDVHLTQTGAILGTPAYMSPEQARGETVDGRSDLYSLGAVLYKLATGEVPFRGATTMAVLMALATETPRPPSEINPEVPPALNDLILRLLAKKPDERFESAQGVAEAIRAIEQASPKSEVQSPKSADGGGHRRARWPLVATAAAAFFLLAAIVIIVRDKDGKEVYRATVPDGGSATLTEADVASKVDPALRDGSASPSPGGRSTSPPRSVVANLAEPPPLDEWLKDREVLTVAQDGSGQFQTIQAALDALSPGEVVSVLDRGPYRERLVLDGVPRDTGLISEKGTVIELSEWKFAWKEGLGDMYLGHAFSNTDGFRLHGFEMVFPQPIKLGRRLEVHHTAGLVVEHCHFRAPPTYTWDGPPLMFGNHYNKGAGLSVWVRQCLIEGYLDIEGRAQDGLTVVIEQNLFTSGRIQHHLHFHGDAWKQVVVRKNIFTGKADCDLLVNDGWEPSSALDVANNTSLTERDLVIFLTTSLRGAVEIRNNLRTSPRLLGVMQGAEKDIGVGKKTWRVDHNAYPDVSNAEPTEANENLVPRAPADIPMTPRFLSKNPADADYLRIAADSLLAKAGAGGDWPSYVGALLPGTAPKDGDWFTRLREQWHVTEVETTTADVADIPPPVEIPEPPPLEEWLKGRTALTVAQDGSGQFKTIQQALDALQPRQVIKVLDAGPYRERLEIEDLPVDSGLVSVKGTIIELPEYVPHYKNELDQQVYIGHLFFDMDGFRLAGFTFVFPEVPEFPNTISHGLPLSRCGGLVLEQCWIQRPVKGPVTAIVGYNAGGSVKPSFVRECRFDGMLLLAPYNDQAMTLVTRNLFFGDGGTAHVNGACVCRYLGIRNNVFLGNGGGLWSDRPNDLRRFEISNNTFLGREPVRFRELHPQVDVIVCNNLRLRPGLLAVLKGAENARGEILSRWHIGRNCYPRELTPDENWKAEQIVPPAAGDIVGIPKFISKVVGDRDYLRPVADDPIARSGVGGDWPDYLGALPPGPAPQDGDWFTRMQERWQVSELKTSTVDVADIPPPFEISEPPPLEEWLKGRSVLTVAQDGSGQFKTIQAALDALQPGQVIKVLDRGPYRETLYAQLPPNTGLVSDQQTVIEIGDPRPRGKNDYPGGGHALFSADGFRISGIVFGDEQADKLIGGQFVLTLLNPSGLVIEQCWLRCRRKEPWCAALDVAWWGGEIRAAPCFVRECQFDGELVVLATGAERRRPAIVVEQNWFRDIDLHAQLWITGNPRSVVRHNLFDGALDRAISMTNTTGTEGLEIYNNTIPSTRIAVEQNVENRKVTVRNNLLGSNTAFFGEAAEELPRAITGWQVGRNQYASVSTAGHFFPKRPSELFGEFEFISSDPADPNYRRLRPESAAATSGAGGAWADYIGALSPGPAPKEGDWFTRLRERWRVTKPQAKAGRAVKIPPPNEIPEAPSLEEWLKDREVLTVAQDGSGQFKSIQAALEALQPGQVIKVLDAGPYRERLEMADVPADTGIVSEKTTVLELPAYHLHYKDAVHEYYKGHHFRDTDGFRIAGFTFRFPARGNEPSYGLQTHRGGGFMLERCWLQSPVEAIVGYHAGGSSKLSCVRECRIDGTLHLGSLDNEQAATLVTRNLFFGEQGVLHVGLDCMYKYVGIRNNVFANPQQGLEIHPAKQLARLEISNNTFLGGNPVFFVRSLPPGEVVVCNNLRLRAGLLALIGGAEKQRDEVVQAWHVGHNCYPREPAPDDWPQEQVVRRFPDDILATPRFVSKVAGDRDYLRPAADDPIARAGAGGAWPDYIGAVPPGPSPNEGDWFTWLQESGRLSP